MARAIIHNSDYPSVADAKTAIDRYFSERNTEFIRSPRKAGRTIWGKERVPCDFQEANNCKGPALFTGLSRSIFRLYYFLMERG